MKETSGIQILDMDDQEKLIKAHDDSSLSCTIKLEDNIVKISIPKISVPNDNNCDMTLVFPKSQFKTLIQDLYMS